MAMKQLHPGVKWLFFIRGIFSGIFLLFFLSIFFMGGIIYLFTSGLLHYNIFMTILPITFLICIIFLSWIYSNLAYKFWTYEFTSDHLQVERGIIWKVYSNVPYERIQSVDVTRGIIARLCGFSTLSIQTAGYSMPVNGRRGIGAEGYIPAVSKDEAEKLRTFLIQKISKKKTSGL